METRQQHKDTLKGHISDSSHGSQGINYDLSFVEGHSCGHCVPETSGCFHSQGMLKDRKMQGAIFFE